MSWLTHFSDLASHLVFQSFTQIYFSEIFLEKTFNKMCLTKLLIYQLHYNKPEGKSTHAVLLLSIKVNVLKTSAAYVR